MHGWTSLAASIGSKAMSRRSAPGRSRSPGDVSWISGAAERAAGPAVGLGLALAQPERGAIVVNGDGCTLMNLGCLVTLAHHRANVFLLVMDNALYEVTGGQLVAAGGAGNVEEEAMTSLGTRWAIRLITSSLSPDQAEVVILRVIGQLGVDEVAAIMGKRRGTIRVLQHRALRRLAQVLQGESVTP